MTDFASNTARHAEEAAPAAVSKHAHVTTLAGLRVALRPSGAMWIEDVRALVVADLHLEKGSAYAARGQMLPPWDTRETLRRLCAEAAATDPAIIVLLGDTLHDGGAGGRMGVQDAATLEALAVRARLVWITGNHDHEGPQGLAGESAGEMAFGELVLRHEPRAGADHAWAAGHLHPCARIRGLGASTRRRCFVGDGMRIILPAFGSYAGGLNVLDLAYEGLFAGERQVVALGRERCVKVAAERLAGD